MPFGENGRLKCLSVNLDALDKLIGGWTKTQEPYAAMHALQRSGAPCCGGDNNYVFGELLGFSPQEIETMAAEGVI